MSTFICDVPTEDMAEFGGLKEPTRVDVRRKLRMMRELMALNGRGIGEAIARIARANGMGAGTLRTHYDNYRHTTDAGGDPDWRVLVDRKIEGKSAGRPGVPEWLVQHWKGLCEKHHRKIEPAHRELVRQWQAGYIPEGAPAGAEWPTYDPDTQLPKGCSLGNLRQKYRPSDFELDAMRAGLGSALGKFGPKVLTTRVGLWVGSHYMVDDVKRDMEFLLLGHGGQRVIPLELGVLDVFSGDRFAVQRRPQYRRPDGTLDKIKEREMRFLAASVLRNIGYSPRGTEFVAELGTAALREKLMAFLGAHSGGKITRREPGNLGREQAIGGYWGRGGGNPRHKPHLESHHNLLHNEADGLLVPVGHDRNPPEWLYGHQCVTDEVIEWMRKLPPEQAAQLRAFHLEWWQGCAMLARIDERIAWRTDHALEGWIDCGHTLVEYCADLINDRWIGPEEFAALAPIAQQRLVAAGRAHPDFIRARKLAPREVFSRGMGDLVKLPDAVIAMLFCDRELGDDLRSPKPKQLTADGLLSLEDFTVAPEAMLFERTIEAAQGGSLRLEERRDYTIALNPFDTERLWVYDARGAYLGTAPRRVKPSRIDQPAILRALGAYEHEKALLTAPLAERHADTTRLIEDIQAHNERVVEGAPVTAEAIAEARKVKKQEAAVLAVGRALRRDAGQNIQHPTSNTQHPISDQPQPTIEEQC